MELLLLDELREKGKETMEESDCERQEYEQITRNNFKDDEGMIL